MIPKEVQRKRTKGWRMPKNTISVTRPGRWGNPYKVVDIGDDCYSVFLDMGKADLLVAWALPKYMAINLALEKFEEGINIELAKKELKGKNLACFCKIGEPCHRKILLKIANQ